MKSGLRDRNNVELRVTLLGFPMSVSMKSGLRDRNNLTAITVSTSPKTRVSMKSGLRDRNNVLPDDSDSLQQSVSQ